MVQKLFDRDAKIGLGLPEVFWARDEVSTVRRHVAHVS
jgi:hypothetical protein